MLYLCPPKEGLSLAGHHFVNPWKKIIFTIDMNDQSNKTNEFLNFFEINRNQMDPVVDFNVHGKRPISNVAEQI